MDEDEELLVEIADVEYKTQYTLHPRETLLQLLREEPSIYKRCIFTLKGYNLAICTTLQNEQSESTKIAIKGRQNCGICFDGDEVVVKLVLLDRSFVIGVLKHHRFYSSYKFVCRFDPWGDKMMKPIDGMVHQVRIHNLDVLESIKLQGGMDDVHMVKFLKWKSNCLAPLGSISNTTSDLLNTFQAQLDSLYQFEPDEGGKNDKTESLNDRMDIECASENRRHFDGAISIDNENCHFQDDAFTVQYKEICLDNGQETYMYIIGVHVADVSHYVQKEDLIDRRASKIGGTYYKGCGTAHRYMLPDCFRKKCALRWSDEKKLALSVEFVIFPDKTVKFIEVCKSTVCVVRNYKFDEVQSIIDNNLQQRPNRRVFLAPNVTQNEVLKIEYLLKASNILHSKRLGDAKYYCKENKGPDDALRLVEEISLEANRQIAQYLSECTTLNTCVPYRSQQAPTEENILNWCKQNKSILPISFYFLTYFVIESKEVHYHLYKELNKLPIAFQYKNCEVLLKQSTSNSLQTALADNYSLKDLLILIETENTHPQFNLAIRRWFGIQNKAEFCNQPMDIGHYQLQFDRYVQFTSPLRRHMDLVIHRLVKWSLSCETSPPPYTSDEIKNLCIAMNPKNENRKRYKEDSKVVEFVDSNKNVGWNECIVEEFDESGLYLCISKLKEKSFQIEYRHLMLSEKPIIKKLSSAEDECEHDLSNSEIETDYDDDNFARGRGVNREHKKFNDNISLLLSWERRLYDTRESRHPSARTTRKKPDCREPLQQVDNPRSPPGTVSGRQPELPMASVETGSSIISKAASMDRVDTDSASAWILSGKSKSTPPVSSKKRQSKTIKKRAKKNKKKQKRNTECQSDEYATANENSDENNKYVTAEEDTDDDDDDLDNIPHLKYVEYDNVFGTKTEAIDSDVSTNKRRDDEFHVKGTANSTLHANNVNSFLSTKSLFDAESGELHQEAIPEIEIKTFLDPHVYRPSVSTKTWKKLRCAIMSKASDTTIKNIVKSMVGAKHHCSLNQNITYKSTVTSEMVRHEQFKEQHVKFSLNVEPGMLMRIQLGSPRLKLRMEHMDKIEYPIELVSLTNEKQFCNDVNFCILHRKHSLKCFATNHSGSMIKTQYSDIEIYKDDWLPILAMEAAMNAANCSETVVCSNISITFKTDERGLIKGTMKLDRDFCEQRKIILNSTKEKKFTSNTETDVNKKIYIDDYICVRSPGGHSSARISLYHGNLISYKSCEENSRKIILKFEINHQSSKQSLSFWKSKGSTVEFLQKAIPDR